MSELPTGLRRAPLARTDAPEVTAVWRACELHDDGESLFVEDDFVAAWKRPSFDFSRHTIGLREGDALVALAMLFGERDVFACVLPSHRGRGIGRWLLEWTEQAARAVGNTVTGQSISKNDPAAAALLEARGYEPRYESWIFDIELDREPDPPRLPPGYAFRAFVPGVDDRTVHRVTEEAFSEWPDHDPDTFEDWAAETLGRSGFVPEHIALAVRGEEVAGVAVLIDDETAGMWVNQLAVARAHRRRGLAHALLAHTFGLSWRAGHRHSGLATDSRTGARGLYEQVGMHVTRTFTEYFKAL
jgi:GNAT superfamily N-acetyltransferase